MPVINSYSALVSSVIEVAEDDSAEFTTYIGTAIDLAELRLTRELDTLGIIQSATVTAVSGNCLVTKPSGYRNGQDLWYVNASSGERVIMKKKTYSFVLDYWPVSSSVGNPKYFSDVDVSTFIIAPTANTSIAMTLRHEGRPTALTSANPTNYFTEQCADALFFAVMNEMCKFSRNETLGQKYEQQYTNARDTIINEGRRGRRDNSGEPKKGGSLNTLQQEST